MPTIIQLQQGTACVEEMERAREARRKLRQVRQNLMTPSPELLGECGPVLEEAAGLLGSLLENRNSSAPHNDLRDELQELRRELTVVAALMDQAACYYLGWAQMLGAAVTGYTSYGDVPPLRVESRVSLEG